MKDLLANSLLPFRTKRQRLRGESATVRRAGVRGEVGERGYAGFRNGGAEFILQRFDDEHFGAELHGTLNVDDLDRWWDRISQKTLDRTLSGRSVQWSDRPSVGTRSQFHRFGRCLLAHWQRE